MINKMHLKKRRRERGREGRKEPEAQSSRRCLRAEGEGQRLGQGCACRATLVAHLS